MRRRCLTTAVAARRKMKIMKPFLDVLGLISASLLVRSHYRKMPILACLKSKNRSKSPFSIGLVFSIVSESTVGRRKSSSFAPAESEPKIQRAFKLARSRPHRRRRFSRGFTPESAASLLMPAVRRSTRKSAGKPPSTFNPEEEENKPQ